MRVRLLCLLITACVCVTAVAAQKKARPSPAHFVAVKAGYLLDVNRGKLVKDAVILIRGNRIEAVGTAGKLRIPKKAEVVNLSSATVLPGLIDAHTHLAWGRPQTPAQTVGAEDARTTLLAGFTSVRNLGSTGGADVALRDAIGAGKTPGPRMQAAGAALGRKGGVCDQVFAGEGVANGPAAAADRVRQLVAAGVDVIKLCAGGGVLPSPAEEKATEYSEEEIRAIVEEAHRLGRKVAAHAHGPQAIQNAVRAGVDSIEHGGLIDETSAQLMRERKVYLVPTLYRSTWVAENAQKNGAAPADVQKLQEARALAEANVRRAIALGVRVALGTDATVYPHGLNARELAVYVRLGMSPLEAVRTATTNAADLMGWSDRVGSITPGKLADLIAVEGNPLEDVTVLERVKFVMKDGQVVRNEFR